MLSTRLPFSRLQGTHAFQDGQLLKTVTTALRGEELVRSIHRGTPQHHSGTSPRQSLVAAPSASSIVPSTYPPLGAGLPVTLPQAPGSTTTVPPGGAAGPGAGAPPPLSVLPLSSVARSLFVAAISSSPLLLTPALAALSLFAHPKHPLLDPDTNPAVRFLLERTMYNQFCAGAAAEEVRRCVQDLRTMGYAGVILGYAPEAVPVEKTFDTTVEEARAKDRAQVDSWRKGTLATVDLAGAGGYVSLKFTGAGNQAVQDLLHGNHPSPQLEDALVQICERAKARHVRLLFDAEQQSIQPTIDAWTLEFQRRYNTGPDQRALVYGTYQAYLRSTPATLSQHLDIARKEGFVLGAKLVRGAYLDTEPRHLIWATKEDTDAAYDGLAASLIKGEYNDLLTTSSSSSTDAFPKVNLFIASHNRRSVEHARALHEAQTRKGIRHAEVSYGQLYGMADDLSCDLVQSNPAAPQEVEASEPPKVYKAVVWGSVGECMKYLLRRAFENKDAASRTLDTKNAMVKELKRRLLGQ